MEIVHEITIDLLRPKKQIIKVTQEDSTRRILLTTLANGAPYDVTSDLESGETLLTMVEYRRADGTSGIYDTTSDGRTAVESGGVGRWLVNLDGTCFTVPGWAQINVRFMTEGGKVLHTFAISVRVQDTACPDESGGDPTQIESIADMKAAISELFNASMSEEAKNALLNLLAHVAYIDEHGQDYLDDLEAELFRTADLVSISAVFEQGSAVIYDTDDLDTLKQYLTVTATYEDLSTREITGYTLSGTLTAGTSTITVSYGGKTATFDATVSQRYSYSLSSGLLTKIQGVLSGGSELGGYISESTTHLNTRRTFLLKSVNNRPTLYKSSDTGSTFTPSEYYPVPVPTGATQVTVAITPNTQFFNIVEFYYDSTHPRGYVKFAETGWKQGSFTRELTEGTTFVGVSSKYNSAGTSYPTEPTELTIAFS